MQPWEQEKTVKQQKLKKESRNLREKIGLVTHAITLSTVACSIIYGTLLYEFSKQIIFKIDPGLKK